MIDFDGIAIEFVREVGVLEVPLSYLTPDLLGELQTRFDFAEAEQGGVWAEFAVGMEWRDGKPFLFSTRDSLVDVVYPKRRTAR